jgi:hypothetical protein
MVGGTFQGSNDAGTWTDLAPPIQSTPAEGQYTTLNPVLQNPFRYFRYLSPDGGYGNVAELQFNTQPLTSPPAAPTSPTFTATATSLNFAWADNSTNEDGFTIQLSTSPDFTPAATNTLSIPAGVARAANHTYGDLTNGATYYFRVAAYNGAGTSAFATYGPVTFTGNPTTQLTGALDGTTGSWRDAGNTFHKAFDNDTATFFDAPTGAASVGLDLGAPAVLSSVRFHPRAGLAWRMVDGVFQGSNDNATWTTLVTVTSEPAEGRFTSLPVSNPTAFRYVRYLSAAWGYGNVAEVQFYGHPAPVTPPPADRIPVRVSASDAATPSNTPTAAVDGDLATYYLSAAADGTIELDPDGYAATIYHLTFSPAPGQAASMVGGKFQWMGDYTPWNDLYTITTPPAEGALTTLSFGPQGRGALAIRYVPPAGTHASIAEFHLFGTPIPRAPYDVDPELITGSPIGTPGSWHDSGNDLTKAFDGDPSTFFDAPTSQASVGLHMSYPHSVTSVRATPRAGLADRMIGGQFQTSYDGVTWETFYTVTSAPADNGSPTTYDFRALGVFVPYADYVRYLSPDGGFGNVAELEFIGLPSVAMPGPTI